MTQEELRQILSNNIKQKRKLFSLTQEKLSEMAGLSAQTINDIEGCRTWVSDKTLIKISEVLHTTPADLLVNIENSESSSNFDYVTLKNELLKGISNSIDKTFSTIK